jgi:DNA-binding PadR family transcriptional regulator
VSAKRDLAPGEWSCLALLADRQAHGWALAKDLSRGGEIGQVWAVGRPLVYRALDVLEQRGLIEPAGREQGARGPERTLFQVTEEGRSALAGWLAEPVDHVRDMRSLFLLKLVLSERAGIESRPLLLAQRALALPALGALEARLHRSVGAEHVFVRFRLETTRSVVAFIDEMLAADAPPAGAPRAPSRRATSSA